MLLQGRLLIDPELPPRIGWLRIERGRIAAMDNGSPPGIVNFGDPQCIICPGFIDAHLHLPQFDSIGCDGLELMQWLREVIYPAESAWGHAETAAARIEAAFARLLRAGTLGFGGWLTSHANTLGMVIDTAQRLPLRAVVGQTLMDRNGPPALINQLPQPPRPVDNPRLSISVNPRFALACSEALLTLAGDFAGEQTIIQTHLAETLRECEIVRELFPNAPHYAGVYDRYGLLNERTLLGHCVHLDARQWSLLAQRGCTVVHCPAANTFLRAGLFDFASALQHGVPVALGSDVAAGPDVAMPQVARAMIDVAKVRAMTIDEHAHVPTPAQIWRMITSGNADALGWRDGGRLEVAAAADLLIIRPTIPIDAHLIGRLIYDWQESWIEQRIVDGRVMHVQ